MKIRLRSDDKGAWKVKPPNTTDRPQTRINQPPKTWLLTNTAKLRYDTVDQRALKSWRDGQLNLAHGPETKNKEKLNQKPSSSEETVQTIVRGGSSGGRSETTGVGFVKEVGFKPGVKERWSYRCTEQSGEEVMGEEICE